MSHTPVPTVPGPEYGPAQPAPAKGNGLALTGMILATVALLLCLIPIVNWFAVFLGVLALIFGIVGLVKARDGRPGRGMAVAAVVIAVLSGIGFAVSTAFTLAAVDAVDEAVGDASAELDADLGRMDGSATEDILASDLTVELGTFQAVEDEYGFVETVLPVTVVNNADEAFSYDVQIEAVDAEGKRIADDILLVSDLAPNQSQDQEVFVFVESDKVDALKKATFQIVEVSQY
jgi:hypothetical protein